ncbi:MAG TPA: hypothetical protein VGP44_11890 [Gemmatimonadales bacterium]|nr:hypothetical protein [Gemmatimonadales bacterium]
MAQEGTQPSSSAQPPKFLDRLRTALQIRGHSPELVAALVGWVRDFIRFHNLRHPEALTAKSRVGR